MNEGGGGGGAQLRSLKHGTFLGAVILAARKWV